MAVTSLKNLMKQLKLMKKESCHLQHELHESSSHVSKLDNKVADMRHFLSHKTASVGCNFEPTPTADRGCKNVSSTEMYDISFVDISALENNASDDCHCVHRSVSTQNPKTSEAENTEPPNNSGDADDCMVGSCKSSVEPRNTCKDNNKCGSVSSSSGNDIVIHTEANRDDISLFPALSNDAGNERDILWMSVRDYRRPSPVRSSDTPDDGGDDMQAPFCFDKATRSSVAAYRHAATNTALGYEDFVMDTDFQNMASVSKRLFTRWPLDGSYRASLAVQTAAVTFVHRSRNVPACPPVHRSLGDVGVTGSGQMACEEVAGDADGDSCSGKFQSCAIRGSDDTAPSYPTPQHGLVSMPSTAAPALPDAKTDMLHSLLSMMRTDNKDDVSRTVLAMSSSADTCVAMRQAGCLPLLIQMLHGSNNDSWLLGNNRGNTATRARVSAVLHNIVHCNPDKKRGGCEARVLHLLESVRAHCDRLRAETVDEPNDGKSVPSLDHCPDQSVAALMKLSYDDHYRHAICSLGGLQAMADLLDVDYVTGVMKGTPDLVNSRGDVRRRYTCMILTNLTFGDGRNKALFCLMTPALTALVALVTAKNEELCQVAASVLRNLSWRADLCSKRALREVGAVSALMTAALQVRKEAALKCLLSALWNLSSHCSVNKAEICGVPGALRFLVSVLARGSGCVGKPGVKAYAVVENGGGVLRNVSSHVAGCEACRMTLRENGSHRLLLAHLQSPSLTVVSNACGTLWNLSARCEEDQRLLRDLGAISLLQNLVHSKHRMIALGSKATLRNLISCPRDDIRHSVAAGTPVSDDPVLSERKRDSCQGDGSGRDVSELCDVVDSSLECSRLGNRMTDERRSAQHSNSVRCFPTEHMVTSVENRLCRGSGLWRHMGQNSESLLHPEVTAEHQDNISGDRSHNHQAIIKSSSLLLRRHNGVRGPDPTDDARLHGTQSHCYVTNMPRATLDTPESTRIGQPSPVMEASGFCQGVSAVGAGVSSFSAPKTARAMPVSDAEHKPSQLDRVCLQRLMPSSVVTSQRGAQSQPSHDRVGLDFVQNAISGQPIDYSFKCPADSKAIHHAHRQPKILHPFSDSLPPSSFDASVPCRGSRGFLPKSSAGQGQGPPSTFRPCTEPDLELGYERPTNFGLRYAEGNDEDGASCQGVHATRFGAPPTGFRSGARCVECQYTEASDLLEQDTEDDQVVTFCTEGTPFLSKAPSLTDLRNIGLEANGLPGVFQDMGLKEVVVGLDREVVVGLDREDGDSVKNFAALYGESGGDGQCLWKEGRSGRPVIRQHVVSFPKSNDADGGSQDDQTKAFCEEGTPISSMSRVSSLSSLHCSEARHSVDRVGSTELPNAHRVVGVSVVKGDGDPGGQPASLTNERRHDQTKEMKTVTFREDRTGRCRQQQMEETPLMFSRSSSIGSLSSFDAQSVHSSLVSEYSWRTSQMISPSELPDSPSESMPTASSYDAIHAPQSDGAMFKIPREERKGVHGVQSADDCWAASAAEDRLVRDSAFVVVAISSPSGQPVAYGDERSPRLFVSSDDVDPATDVVVVATPTRPAVADALDHTVVVRYSTASAGGSSGSSMSDVSQGEEDILARCINDAMPAPSSMRKMRRTSSDNSLRRWDCPTPRTDVSGSLSHLPQRASLLSQPGDCRTSVRLNGGSTGQTVDSQGRLLSPTRRSAQHRPAGRGMASLQYQDCAEDSLITFQTEGALDTADVTRRAGHVASGGGVQAASWDTGGLTPYPGSPCKSGDGGLSSWRPVEAVERQLLNDTIQSAMPKPRPLRLSMHNVRPSSDRRVHPGVAVKPERSRSTACRAVTEEETGSSGFQSAPAARRSAGRLPTQNGRSSTKDILAGAAQDTLTVYATEGTPSNISSGTSLSDLTTESQDEGRRRAGDRARSVSLPPRTGDSCVGMFTVGLQDKPCLYAVEGTPATFSRNDSLSSLELVDDGVGESTQWVPDFPVVAPPTLKINSEKVYPILNG